MGLSVVKQSDGLFFAESFSGETEAILYVDAPLAIVSNRELSYKLNTMESYSEIVRELANVAVSTGPVLLKIEVGNCREMFTDLAK